MWLGYHAHAVLIDGILGANCYALDVPHLPGRFGGVSFPRGLVLVMSESNSRNRAMMQKVKVLAKLRAGDSVAEFIQRCRE